MRQQTTAPGVVTNTKWTLSTNPPSRPILAADAGCPHHRLLLSVAQHHGAGREQHLGAEPYPDSVFLLGSASWGKPGRSNLLQEKIPKPKPSLQSRTKDAL